MSRLRGDAAGPGPHGAATAVAMAATGFLAFQAGLVLGGKTATASASVLPGFELPAPGSRLEVPDGARATVWQGDRALSLGPWASNGPILVGLAEDGSVGRVVAEPQEVAAALGRSAVMYSGVGR